MKKITLFVNEKTDPGFETSLRVRRFLEGKGAAVRAAGLSGPPAGFGEPAGGDFMAASDAGVIIGGDGTILKALRVFSRWDVPVIGVNKGTMGFLSDIPPDRAEEALGRMLDGRFRIEERMQLMLFSEREEYGDCLNEVAFKHVFGNGVGEFQVSSDRTRIARYTGDGVLIAAPTGSTAYSLSAGGPLINPACEVILVQPIAPHSFYNRPIILSSSETVTVEFDPLQTSVFLDGEAVRASGGKLSVAKSPRTARFIKLDGYNFYTTLFEKIR